MNWFWLAGMLFAAGFSGSPCTIVDAVCLAFLWPLYLGEALRKALRK